jgi:CRISPR-associated protein Cmr2
MPLVHWVCVPSVSGGYPAQWREAQRLLAARRRIRDFPAVEWPQRALCVLGPRWPAEPVPGGLKEHEKAALSAAGWVKRRWRKIHDLGGFPSTASIASAPFRRAVLELCVPKTSSTSCDQAIFVNQATDTSLL